MALVYADRVKETTTTTGVGTYSLAGAETGFQTFVAGIATGNTCRYGVTDGTDWEVNLGTVTSGTPDTLSRDTIYASSNAGAAVNWTAGTRVIFNTVPTQTIDEIVAHIAAANPHSGSAASGANSDITSLSGLTTPLTVTQGGIGTASNTAYAVLCGGTTGTGAVQSIASVGTSGQVLTSNGASALPTFQTAAGGGAWNLIQTQTISGTPSAVDFTTGIDSTYDHYVLVLENITVTADIYLGWRVSTDGGSTFESTNYYCHTPNLAASSATYAATVLSNSTYVHLGNCTAGAGDVLAGVLNFFNPSSTANFKSINGVLTGTSYENRLPGGQWRGTSAVNAIRIFAGGSMDGGTMTLYGVAK